MFRQLDLDCIETIFCEKGYLINLFQTPHNYRDTFPECSKISHFFQQFANFRWIHKQWTSAKFWNIFIWTFVDFPLNFTAIRGLQRLIEFCWFSVEIPEHFDLHFEFLKKRKLSSKTKTNRRAAQEALHQNFLNSSFSVLNEKLRPPPPAAAGSTTRRMYASAPASCTVLTWGRNMESSRS